MKKYIWFGLIILLLVIIIGVVVINSYDVQYDLSPTTLKNIILPDIIQQKIKSNSEVTISPRFTSWKAHITGNESIFYDTKIEGNTICIKEQFPEQKIIQMCEEGDSEGDFIINCKNVTYQQPDSIKLTSNNSEKMLAKNSSELCYDLDPNLKYYKFGEESIIIQGDTSYPSRNTNLTQQPGFSHLDIITNGSYSSLILYYPFDLDKGINVYDYSNNGYDGLIENGNGEEINDSSSVFGESYFQTDNSFPYDYVDAGDRDISGTNFTIMAWVNPDIISGDERNIISKWSFSTGEFEFIFRITQQRALQAFVASGNKKQTNSLAINQSEWTHVAFVYDYDNDDGLIYINGDAAQLVTDTPFPKITDTNVPITIGRQASNNDEFIGKIDEVMIFNSNLTKAEIQSIYQNTSRRFVPEGIQEFVATNVGQNGTINRLNVSVNTQQYLDSNMSIRVYDWFGVEYNDSVNGDRDSNLLTYFHFDNRVGYDSGTFIYDFAGYGNNGTAENGLTFVDGGGKFAGAYQFDGTNDQVRVNENVSLKQELPVTISTWINVSTLGTDYIFTNDDQDSSYYGIWFEIASGDLLRACFGDGGGLTIANRRCVTGNTPIVADEWSHITAVLNNGTDLRLYSDGYLDSDAGDITGSADTLVYSGADSTFIGSDGDSDYLDGKIDEFMFWNSTMNDTDVLEIYSIGRLNYETPTSWENVPMGVNQNISFNITTSTEYSRLEFNYTGLFYSPVLYNNLTLTTWGSGVVVDEDNEYPIFFSLNETPGNSTDFTSTASYNFNITMNSTNGSVGLQFNNINYTASNNSASSLDVWNRTLTNLNAGVHSYLWWAYGNGTSANFNSTAIQYYTINQIIPEGNITNSTSLTVDFGTNTLINHSEINDGDSDLVYNLYRDNVSMLGGENATLGVGVYEYVLNTTGGQNYTANASMDIEILTVNQIASQTSLLFDLSSPQTYTTAITPTCSVLSGEGTSVLTVNGTTISSGSPITLGAGGWTFNCTLASTQNYTASSNSSIFVITQDSPALNLGFTPGGTVTYGTETTATGSGCPSELTCNLSRDNVYLDNPEVTTLAAGSYTYVYNTTGNSNYTSASETDILTVNNATPTAQLTFNPGQSVDYNISVEVNLTESNTGDGGVVYNIFRDGTLVGSGGENITLGVGTYSYLLNTTGGHNYTDVANLDTESLTINQIAGDVTLYLNNSQSNTTINSGDSIYLNATLSAGEGNIELYNNEQLISDNNTTLVNLTTFTSVGEYNISARYIGTQNFTEDWETLWVFVVSSGAPVVNIVYPASTGLWFNVEDVNVNYTVTGANIQACWYTNSSGSSNYTLASCGNATSSLWDQGLNNVIVYANNTAGEIGSDNINFNVDSIAPTASITYPLSQTYDALITLLNATITETNPSSCWVWNGSINSSLQTCGVNFTSLASSEGSNTWTFYINDSANNLGSDSVTFSVDTTAPTITINNPVQQFNTTASVQQVNMSINGDYSTCRYSLDSGSTNTSFTCAGQNFTTAISEGLNNITAYVIDAQDNQNLDSVVMRRDSTAPIMTLINQTLESGKTLDYQISGSDGGVGRDCFSVNNTALFNVTCSGYMTNVTGLPNGIHYAQITINDTLNNNQVQEMFVNISTTVTRTLEFDYGVTEFGGNRPEEICFKLFGGDFCFQNKDGGIIIR